MEMSRSIFCTCWVVLVVVRKTASLILVALIDDCVDGVFH